MASTIYSTKSLIDTVTDTLLNSVGTVTRNSYGQITLEPGSSCAIQKSFDSVGTNAIIDCSMLKLEQIVYNENSNKKSRYDANVRMNIMIRYYDEVLNESGETTGFNAGNSMSIQLLPYFYNESEEIRAYEIEALGKRIKTLWIEFINDSDYKVTFSKNKLYSDTNVGTAVKEEITSQGKLESTDFTSDPTGFINKYYGNEATFKYTYIIDGNGEHTGIIRPDGTIYSWL